MKTSFGSQIESLERIRKAWRFWRIWFGRLFHDIHGKENKERKLAI